MENWTIEKLNQFIEDQIEESNVLDYKAADALAKTDSKKNEISKDVSAFANSNGGVIIYGIKEFDEKSKAHLPEKIDPVSRINISKEWLEQVISTKIQPKIEGVEIIPITVNEEDNTVVYVVEIPKSTTAHQAARYKYYKRYNFQSEPMLDYEIRDVMNRSSHPVIELDFEIETKEVEENNFMPTMDLGQSKTVEKTICNTLKIIARNKGAVYANYVNYYVEINRDFLDKEEYQNLRTYKKDNSGRVYAEYYGENTIRDVVVGGMYKYGPSRFDPILPGMHSRADKIKLTKDFEPFNEKYIECKVYADNALPRTGRIKIVDIPVTQIKSK